MPPFFNSSNTRFDYSSLEPSPSLKQQGMILALLLLRSLKPQVKKMRNSQKKSINQGDPLLYDMDKAKGAIGEQIRKIKKIP